MKTSLSIFALATILFISSCKKDDNNPGPGTTPAKPDTLSTGWKKIALDSDVVYSDIFFINNSKGYLIGNKVYKSTDGGLSWAVIANRANLGNIAVTPNDNAFFCGVDDSVYRYVNATNTFSSQRIPGTSYGQDIFFVDNNNGYFLTAGGLYSSADAGVTWSKINATGIGFNLNGYASEYFININTGWIVNSNGIFKTNGNASSWIKATISGTQPTDAFATIHATPNGTVYACTSVGELYKSVDGGVSFSQIKVFPSVQGYCDMHFIDNVTGYICVGKRIYKTIDAGATWSIVVALGESIPIEIHFTDATHGWACGTKGLVLVFN